MYRPYLYHLGQPLFIHPTTEKYAMEFPHPMMPPRSVRYLIGALTLLIRTVLKITMLFCDEGSDGSHTTTEKNFVWDLHDLLVRFMVNYVPIPGSECLVLTKLDWKGAVHLL